MPLKLFTFFIGIFISILLFLPFFTVASVVDISIVVANVAGIDGVVNIVGVVSTVLISNGVVVSPIRTPFSTRQCFWSPSHPSSDLPSKIAGKPSSPELELRATPSRRGSAMARSNSTASFFGPSE